jgi:hypothetical protein
VKTVDDAVHGPFYVFTLLPQTFPPAQYSFLLICFLFNQQSTERNKIIFHPIAVLKPIYIRVRKQRQHHSGIMFQASEVPDMSEPILLPNNVSDAPDAELEELFQKMKCGHERLRSFRAGNYQMWFMSHRKLAEAGLFYFKNSDCIQCAFCRGVVRGWENSDEPYEEHRRHFPKCPFMMGFNVGNVPSHHFRTRRLH